MKKDIHPKMVPCKVYCDGDVVMETYSTKPELRVDVWSGNHPFLHRTTALYRYRRARREVSEALW